MTPWIKEANSGEIMGPELESPAAWDVEATRGGDGDGGQGEGALEGVGFD